MAQRAGEGADAARIADAIGALWEQVEGALAPIIGKRGVAALYKRSLYLAAASHPWLRLQDEALAAPELDLAVLKPVFARQEGAEALAGGIALLQAFHGLLSSLIGSSLTSRLLDAVWTPLSPSSGPPAQDPSL